MYRTNTNHDFQIVLGVSNINELFEILLHAYTYSSCDTNKHNFPCKLKFHDDRSAIIEVKGNYDNKISA